MHRRSACMGWYVRRGAVLKWQQHVILMFVLPLCRLIVPHFVICIPAHMPCCLRHVGGRARHEALVTILVRFEVTA